jgi:hypothetical protein
MHDSGLDFNTKHGSPREILSLVRAKELAQAALAEAAASRAQTGAVNGIEVLDPAVAEGDLAPTASKAGASTQHQEAGPSVSPSATRPKPARSRAKAQRIVATRRGRRKTATA